jgi:hypothetical protein
MKQSDELRRQIDEHYAISSCDVAIQNVPDTPAGVTCNCTGSFLIRG